MNNKQEIREVFSLDKFKGMDISPGTQKKILDAYVNIMIDQRRQGGKSNVVEK